MVAPSDCELLFTLPRTRVAFIAAACATSVVKDFPRVIGNKAAPWQPDRLEAGRVWDGRAEPILASCKRSLADVEAQGVRVTCEAKLADLAAALRRSPVVSLLAHWVEGIGVEMNDGVHSAAAIADCVPIGWAGVLQFIVCESVPAFDEIRRRSEGGVLIVAPARVQTVLGMTLYKHTIAALAVRPRRFSTAFADVRELLANHLLRSRKMTVLDRLLLNFINQTPSTLGVPTAERKPRPRAHRDGLRRDLAAVRNRTDSRARWYLGALVVVLVTLLGLTVAWSGKPEIVAALAAGLGISVGGALFQLNRLWKELHRIDLSLVALGWMPEDQLDDLLRAIVRGKELASDDEDESTERSASISPSATPPPN